MDPFIGINSLLQKAYNGDKKCENDFFEKIHARISGLVQHKVWGGRHRGGAERNEDIVQEIMTVIIQKYKDRALPQDHLIQWIFTVANNKIRTFIRDRDRKTKRMVSVDDISYTLMTTDDLEQKEIDKELNDLIYRTLNKMSDRCKEIIKALLDDEKKEYIAEQKKHDIPEGTISARIYHCRKYFGRALIKEGFRL